MTYADFAALSTVEQECRIAHWWADSAAARWAFTCSAGRAPQGSWSDETFAQLAADRHAEHCGGVHVVGGAS